MNSKTLTFELKCLELDQTMQTEYEVTRQAIDELTNEIINDDSSQTLEEVTNLVRECLAETISEQVMAELHTQLEGMLLRCIY